MQKKTIIAALFAAGVMSTQVYATTPTPPAAPSATVSQGGGNITFKGEINSGACSIAPDSVNLTIPMGSISASSLTSSGQSNPVPININLVDCDGTKNKVKVTFTGTADKNNTTLLALMGGHASGAGIMLMDSNSNQIALGTASSDLTISPGSSTLRLQAALKKTSGDVTPGTFETIGHFTLAYN